MTNFSMKAYGRKPVFSGFLPGVAGEKGIPAWCYYNNRGQSVCSFGVSDKDHAIMEFSPAHVAYQNVERTGFRTFCRRDGQLFEAFAHGDGDMTIRPNSLSLCWQNEALRVDVRYFIAPECPVGALCRRVTVTNLGAPAELDLLDGLSALVPYGINQDMLKNMTQLAKAWMQVEDVEQRRAYFRVRASLADSAVVTEVVGGNFALGMTEAGELLRPCVDADVVFGYDTSLAEPVGFAAADFDETRGRAANLFPCAFFRRKARLQTGEALVLDELFGQAQSKTVCHAFADTLCAGWFDEKQARAEQLTDELTAAADTHTANPVFDAYCRYTYLDNCLRGGEPIRFVDPDDSSRANVFYLYSRKHGDPEREYNYFRMLAEYYSQGNGNYRDVNQNRRSDVRFHPWVEDGAIRTFFSLLQSDGYNPLVVEQTTFSCADVEDACARVGERDRDAARALLQQPFTPGKLAMAAEAWLFADGGADDFVRRVLARAECEPNASFGEGYWTDHWTYDLDLVESYLSVWPDKEEALLFDTRLPWYETRAVVLPRSERLEQTPRGLRPVRFLDMERKAGVRHRWMREHYGQGEPAQSTLLEKLTLLCAVKSATLDAAGIGVEMEGGKPGWYDALNGLPALNGSSIAETCELNRLLRFTANAVRAYGRPVSLYAEMAALLRGVSALSENLPPLERWREASRCKEVYRERTAFGVSGARETLSAQALCDMLDTLERVTRRGLERAVALGGGVCPTYLSFPDGPEGRLQPLPLFLEGPVRWMKTGRSAAEIARMADAVRHSPLYDDKLRMYKVNASLADMSYEAGRCKAFTPGWLENESIWLHMEYKYLLALLQNGQYERFSQAFRDAAIPFLDPDVYGRSTLENVSFLASSANPDPSVHGRGFVARLSGSTAEFLEMWQIMFFGERPFVMEQGRLTLRLSPMLPDYLIPANGRVSARFLGVCDVTYQIAPNARVCPNACTVAEYALETEDGSARVEQLSSEQAEAVRAGRVRKMTVRIV